MKKLVKNCVSDHGNDDTNDELVAVGAGFSELGTVCITSRAVSH